MAPIIEQLRAGCVTTSPEETEALAGALAAALPEDCTVALQGGLGAGKTAFTRGLARAWGISGPVTSPSYSLLNVHQGTRQLLHLDAYRLDDPEQAEDLLIDDLTRSPWCLVIEWPEHVPASWLEAAWRLTLSIEGTARRIRLIDVPVR